jgi:succinate dehydrogenase / fumarate reductase cytochrome b subunit
MPKPRPKYLNLLKIRLPVPGVISIMHRVSGAALFLLIPVLLYLLQLSLASERGFAAIRGALTTPLAKLALIALLWGFLHHFCAGIRYLVLDLDIGTDLPAARASSWAVLAASILLTLAFGVLLW